MCDCIKEDPDDDDCNCPEDCFRYCRSMYEYIWRLLCGCFSNEAEEAARSDDLYDTEDLQIDPSYSRTSMPSIVPVVANQTYLAAHDAQSHHSDTYRSSKMSMRWG